MIDYSNSIWFRYSRIRLIYTSKSTFIFFNFSQEFNIYWHAASWQLCKNTRDWSPKAFTSWSPWTWITGF